MSTAYGADAFLKVTVDNDDLANELGLSSTQSDYGVDAEITIDTTEGTSLFSDTTTYSMEGNKVNFSDVGGFKMSMLLDEGYSGEISLAVTDIGPMELQIGANKGQQMKVIINPTDTKNMYIDNLDVTTVHGASRAIDQADRAIAYVNETRSSLGAYTNRLEYVTKSMDQTNENMESAISRLKDVDMALEMTDYTKYNVLSQAATSALSQANELPQMALQLLG